MLVRVYLPIALAFFVIAGFLMTSITTEEELVNTERVITIVVVGDALFGDWPNRFAARMEEQLSEKGYEKTTVLFVGNDRDTTSRGTRRIDTAIKYLPDIAVVGLGTRDLISKTPLNFIRNNLQNIITSFKDEGVSVLLVGAKAHFKDGPKYADKFNKLYKELATKNQVELYPLLVKEAILSRRMNEAGGDVNALKGEEDAVDAVVHNLMPSILKLIKTL